MPRKGEIGDIGKTAPGNTVTLLELLLDAVAETGTEVIERPD